MRSAFFHDLKREPTRSAVFTNLIEGTQQAAHISLAEERAHSEERIRHSHQDAKHVSGKHSCIAHAQRLKTSVIPEAFSCRSSVGHAATHIAQSFMHTPCTRDETPSIQHSCNSLSHKQQQCRSRLGSAIPSPPCPCGGRGTDDRSLLRTHRARGSTNSSSPSRKWCSGLRQTEPTICPCGGRGSDSLGPPCTYGVRGYAILSSPRIYVVFKALLFLAHLAHMVFEALQFLALLAHMWWSRIYYY